MSNSGILPSYDHPPLVEVVCGVQFRPIELLLAPHLGLLWQQFRDDYPRCEEVAPLAPVFERFGEGHAVQLEFTDKPPLPRVWFVHKNENGIIQVQRDRFLHNWKKVRPTDEYPRFGKVMELFKARLKTFEDFMSAQNWGPLEIQQLEMTYVNHIELNTSLPSSGDMGAVLPDFTWRSNTRRFLPAPQSFNWRSVFDLPDQQGRLHLTIRSVTNREEKSPLLLLELTARGMSGDSSPAAIWRWFDLAHEWIVRGFTDLTGKSMQEKVWKRTT